MSVLEILQRVRNHLETNGRVSLRMLRREFALDDDTLAEVIEELVNGQRVARREENALAWAGGAAPSAAPAPAGSPAPPRRDGPGVVFGDVDPQVIARCRTFLPALAHRVL